MSRADRLQAERLHGERAVSNVNAAVRNEAGHRVSIVIPVYNEVSTIEQLLRRVFDSPVEKEVIVVDDASTDGSSEILENFAQRHEIILLVQPVNRGKGAAIRRGLAAATGDLFLIQDADLEYDPAEYTRLLEPVWSGRTQVVYGSRFLGRPVHMNPWHRFGNRFVTRVFNLVHGSNLSDTETCYKLFSRQALDGILLRSDRWGIDPEITAKLLRNGYRIDEVPISYSGRQNHEGKKLRWKDGFSVLLATFRYRLFE
jgi:glycosyltransferase involved in cell wall biosynthesis